MAAPRTGKPVPMIAKVMSVALPPCRSFVLNVNSCAAGDRGVRTLAPAGQGPSRVTWSDLDSASADAVIAAQLAFFAARGEPFEWKLFDYDRPADLGSRLAGAGLVPDEEELVMVAPTARVAALTQGPLPAGVRVEQVRGAA